MVEHMTILFLHTNSKVGDHLSKITEPCLPKETQEYPRQVINWICTWEIDNDAISVLDQDPGKVVIIVQT